MSEISPDLTRKVARLSRLRLSDSEVKDLGKEMTSILEYFNQLAEVDVEGVEPMTHPHEMELFLREDLIETTPVNDEGESKVLSSAPEVESGGFKVPPIL